MYLMKKKSFLFFLATAIFGCFAGVMLSACNISDVVGTEDNSVKQPAPSMPKLTVDPNEYQSINVSVALLGSLGDYAEEAAIIYWFKEVTNTVTDKTQVVITDQITEGNKADIAKVLARFGTLLLVDPTEANVKQYAEEMGFDPDASYKNLEVLGLSGFGDRFLSYLSEDYEETSSETIAPSSISVKDIWEVAPMEYLRIEAFAEWAEHIEKKYTEYQEYIAGLNPASSRALTRGSTQTNGNVMDKINLLNFPAVDLKIHIQDKKNYCGYEYDFPAYNVKDYEDCIYDVTCNYSIIPIYDYKGEADYYIVNTSMNWNCKETCIGYKVFKHPWYKRDRRSYLFFPCQGTFYTTPKVTNSAYNVMMTVNGDLHPESIPFDKDVHNSRSFSLDGNVSAGAKGQAGMTGVGVEGNVDANLGFSAEWSKDEYFNIKSIEIDKHVSGASVGHRILVPGGEDGYRPRMVNSALDKGIECPQGREYNTTLTTEEGWIWKVSGTKVNTGDAAITIKLTADTKVSWSSYMVTGAEWRVKEYNHSMSSQEFHIAPPNRVDVGFLKINATTKENGAGLSIFGIKVTDKNGNNVVLNKDNVTTNYGETYNLGLLANKTYDIELKMGTNLASAKTYILSDRQVGGHSDPVQNLDTDKFFNLKN